MRLEADSKCGYYATTKPQIYQILSCFRFYEDYRHDYADLDLIQELKDKGLNSAERYAKYYEDDLDSFIKVDFMSLNNCSIIDPFAGEGEILNYFGKKENQYAVEIDKTRFDRIDCGRKFHGAFEDVELPKNSFDICIFNPAYGDTNGKRNVRHYFEILMEKKIMAHNHKIIMIVPESDAIECLDLVYKDYDILQAFHLKDSEFKQVVLICRSKKYGKLDLTTVYGADRLEELKEEFIIQDTNEFCKISHYSDNVNIPKLLEKMEMKTSRKPSSSYDKIWKWAIDDSEAKLGDIQLITAKPPTISDISNIIASGVINGHIDEIAPHIVAGGVKKVVNKEVERVRVNGKDVDKTIETRLSRAFVSILTKVDGKVVIKEIE